MFGCLSQLVFTDIRNKLIFTTTDGAKNMTRYQLDFAPSEVFFQELDPQVFMILDKTTPNRTVRIISILIRKMNDPFSFFFEVVVVAKFWTEFPNLRCVRQVYILDGQHVDY